MNTFDARAELAVANALRRLQVQPGQPVDVERIQGIWSGYGIRDSDLPAAIERMVQSGRMARAGDPGCGTVTLTPAGERWSRAQPALMEYLLLVPRRERTAFRRRSGVSGTGPGKTRQSHRPGRAAA